MADDSKEKKPSQAKTAFIVRDTPAWLDQHQSWISDGARKLYKTLRTLADVKTGRLFIPGRGWITLRTVQKKAGMSKNTRLKYFRELTALGALKIHRDYVTRLIGGRNLKILSAAQVTLLPLVPPHLQTKSEEQKAKSPHKDSAPPTDQFKKQHRQAPAPTDQSAEKGHLRTNSPTVQRLVHQYSHNPPSPSALPSVDLVGLNHTASAASDLSFSESTTGKTAEKPVCDSQTTRIKPSEVQNLSSFASEHGWSKAECDALLQTEFHVTLAEHLSPKQYTLALRLIEEAVPLPTAFRKQRWR